MPTSKSLLTYGSKVFTSTQTYFSPSSTLPPTYKPTSSLYCFLAGCLPWDDDNNPPTPTQDQKYLKSVQKNIFAVKHITSADVSPVIKRVDWAKDTLYNYYLDNLDMFEKDENGDFVYNFYVKNRYDQVFKCLWNNNGEVSTDEPYFQPGAYGTNNIFVGSDGYKWKYMYTISYAKKIKFMDVLWMPVDVNLNNINPLDSSAGYGNIDVINILNSGNNYDTSVSTVDVVITGDGQGAVGEVTVANGHITDIVMTASGSNYTYANVSFSSSVGNNAIAISPVSPIGGHGRDPISELGCNHTMVTCQFEYGENGNIPTDISYHQIGLLVNPVSSNYPTELANGAIYKTSTDLIVAPGFGKYTNGEKIFQGNSITDYSFIGTILSFDEINNIVKLINTEGNLTLDSSIFGNESETVRTLLSYSNPNFITLSGYIYYLENRSGIERSEDGIEQFKIVLGY